MLLYFLFATGDYRGWGASVLRYTTYRYSSPGQLPGRDKAVGQAPGAVPRCHVQCSGFACYNCQTGPKGAEVITVYGVIFALFHL